MSLSNKMNKTKNLSERFITIECWMISAMNEKELYIYAVLKSLATIEGYTIRRSEIQKKVPFGRDTFGKAWMSLQEKGLLKSIKKRNKNGKFETDFYIIYSKANKDTMDLINEEDFILEEEDKVEVGKINVEESTGMDIEDLDSLIEETSQEQSEEDEIKKAREEMKKDVNNIDSRCKVMRRKDGTYELIYDKTLFKNTKNKTILRDSLCDNMKVIISRTGIAPTSWSNFMASKMNLVDVFQAIKRFKKQGGKTFYYLCCQYITYCENNNRPVNQAIYNQMNSIEKKKNKGKTLEVKDKELLEKLVNERLNNIPSTVYYDMVNELATEGYDADGIEQKIKESVEMEIILEYGECS